jgi:hypothetical protein
VPGGYTAIDVQGLARDKRRPLKIEDPSTTSLISPSRPRGWKPTHPERSAVLILPVRGVQLVAGRFIDVSLLEAYSGRTEVGHTPSRPDGLVCALRARGFSDDELVEAGLAYRHLGASRITDFYRQRVLIPLRDDQGKVCGVIGRNIGDMRWPKYKNPPCTLSTTSLSTSISRSHRQQTKVDRWWSLRAPSTPSRSP